MIEINNLQEYEETLKLAPQDKPILLDFAASWCSPCKMVSALFKQLEPQFTEKDIPLYKINMDDDALKNAMKDQYGITSIPTIIVKSGDTEIQRLVGNEVNGNSLKALLN